MAGDDRALESGDWEAVTGGRVAARTPGRSSSTTFPSAPRPAASGKTLRFTGKTVLKVQNGLIVEELGLDDGVTVPQQLSIIPTA
ncbi:hypothetical protein ACFVTY_09295 [Streptomyces sp. NPDC058067]|uniref:hypothetical protein n=1 Tax=Streptomyces sp. NPDC058067 TaxID=3346324 RepID=UPI0036EBA03C